MENASEALKMFFAVTVFALALSAFFRMTSLAKDTADMVFTSIDKTNYMDYNADISDGSNRKVTFQEIIPTIYRYAQEGYGVTIVDKSDNENGGIVARFDLSTESQVASALWSDKRYSNASQIEKDKSDSIKREIENYLNKYILGKVYSNSVINNIDNLIRDIYSTVDTTGDNPVFTGWLNSNTYQNNNITQRINCDIYGGTTRFSLKTPGVDETDKKYISGTHKAVCAGNGLFDKYKDSEFTEYIVQIDQNEYIQDENGENSDLLVYGTIRYTKKREIIYVKN